MSHSPILTLEDESYLRRASVVALRRVGALRQGLHRASLRNGSTEFSEHRAYSPGDSIRALDWRILAKSRKPFVKHFHDPSSLEATIVLDASGSMMFAGADGRKIDYARRTAMFLARLLLGQRDPVGLIVTAASGDVEIESRSVRSQGKLIENALVSTKPAGETTLSARLARMGSERRSPSHLIIITDGFWELRGFELAIRQLSARRHQVMVLQILSSEELELSLEGAVRFRCMETNQTITAPADEIRAQYQLKLRRHQRQLRTAIERLGGTLDTMQMDVSVGKAITEALLRRQSIAATTRSSAP